ncbi:hypothetical protein LshimejAT787_0100850 [Lyophyllum shimeji]|uniref:Uncharacterized protein n=1 Tax=Lyophyllum shimeji TaxID=47721 RepID=A0A9P3PC55_LYOSH|nr:hypothetical protein LshimejAT787_0100850 [Lyophyllum shimeji]
MLGGQHSPAEHRDVVKFAASPSMGIPQMSPTTLHEWCDRLGRVHSHANVLAGPLRCCLLHHAAFRGVVGHGTSLEPDLNPGRRLGFEQGLQSVSLTHIMPMRTMRKYR